ncbi:unnamed protein product, partial [Scytosiphon promiscuus]
PLREARGQGGTSTAVAQGGRTAGRPGPTEAGMDGRRPRPHLTRTPRTRWQSWAFRWRYPAGAERRRCSSCTSNRRCSSSRLHRTSGRHSSNGILAGAAAAAAAAAAVVLPRPEARSAVARSRVHPPRRR